MTQFAKPYTSPEPKDVHTFAHAYNCDVEVMRGISFYPPMGPRLLVVPVEWLWRPSGTAGKAHRQGKIQLHRGLLDQPVYDLVETFLHEVAHIMQWLRYGMMDHGATWHEAMYQLGQKPMRCHSMGKLQAPMPTLSDLGLEF